MQETPKKSEQGLEELHAFITHTLPLTYHLTFRLNSFSFLFLSLKVKCESYIHAYIHTYIHPLISFLKQGFSKIITKNMITNKKEYNKYIKSRLVKLSQG